MKNIGNLTRARYKYVSNMSEPKILEFLHEHDVDILPSVENPAFYTGKKTCNFTRRQYISAATVSRMLTRKLETFHQEKAGMVQIWAKKGNRNNSISMDNKGKVF